MCVCVHFNESGSQTEARGAQPSLTWGVCLKEYTNRILHHNQLTSCICMMSHLNGFEKHLLSQILVAFQRLFMWEIMRSFTTLFPFPPRNMVPVKNLREIKKEKNKKKPFILFSPFTLTCACSPGRKRPWHYTTDRSAPRNGGSTCGETDTLNCLICRFYLHAVLVYFHEIYMSKHTCLLPILWYTKAYLHPVLSWHYSLERENNSISKPVTPSAMWRPTFVNSNVHTTG